MLLAFRAALAGLLAAVVFSLQAVAQNDDQDTRLQIFDVAYKLARELPLERTYALKSLSPTVTGIPEDFLMRLTSDIEAGLLFATDKKLNLKSRQMTEEIWTEAIEFNSSDFQELYLASSTEVLIILSPRLTGEGVEISLSAYELSGVEVGRIVAATGTILLEMDVVATLGVDVNSIDKKLDTVLDAIAASKPQPLSPDEIREVPYNVGKQLDWFNEKYGVPIEVSKYDAEWYSRYQIEECYFGVKSVDGEITEISIGIRPPACDYEFNGELASKISFGQLYRMGRGQWQSDCLPLNCGNSFDPTLSYVISGFSANGFIDTKFDTVETQLLLKIPRMDNSLVGFVSQSHLNSYDALIRQLFSEIKINSITVGRGMYEYNGERNQPRWENMYKDGVVADPYLIAEKIKGAYSLFDAEGRSAIKQGLTNIGAYNGNIDDMWDAEIENAFVNLLDFLSRNVGKQDFATDYGFDNFALAREDFLRFLNDLNCERRGLLEGTSACQ
jgi:hypothetical protein